MTSRKHVRRLNHFAAIRMLFHRRFSRNMVSTHRINLSKMIVPETQKRRMQCSAVDVYRPEIS